MLTELEHGPDFCTLIYADDRYDYNFVPFKGEIKFRGRGVIDWPTLLVEGIFPDGSSQGGLLYFISEDGNRYKIVYAAYPYCQQNFPNRNQNAENYYHDIVHLDTIIPIYGDAIIIPEGMIDPVPTPFNNIEKVEIQSQ